MTTSPHTDLDGEIETNAESLKLLFGTGLETLHHASHSEYHSTILDVSVIADFDTLHRTDRTDRTLHGPLHTKLTWR